MIERDARYHGNERRDDVCGVKKAAEADFEDNEIKLGQPGKINKSQERHKFEKRRSRDAGLVHHRVFRDNIIRELKQFLVADITVIISDSLVKNIDIGRDKRRDIISRRRQYRLKKTHGRTLPVRPADMDIS